jgi:crotonobetainyl-CoA:carnitine CoA-transferase CaiB-like acyl-CoA transferase
VSGGLQGITVVTVEQAVAAPYASSRLADAGARVIKVERPEGDFARNYDRMVNGQSAYYVWLNRGKESVCLNLRLAADRELLERLIAEADVFIQNLKPGSMARLGFGQAALRARHPRLIACDITGFGESGAYSHLKAYDLIVQAEVGLCAITGTSGGPARVGVSVCDIAAGMYAHNAILQALFHRERNHKGSSIQVSLFDAAADWMNVPILQHNYANHETVRAGVHHPSLTPYGAYRCADDKDVIFSVQNDAEWVNFCTSFMAAPSLIADPRFADNTARLAHRAELEAIVRARFLELSSDRAMEYLDRAGIAFGRLNDLHAVAEHPHVRYIDQETPRGVIRVIAPPAILDGETPTLRPVAALGEHSESIRREFAAAV